MQSPFFIFKSLNKFISKKFNYYKILLNLIELKILII